MEALELTSVFVGVLLKFLAEGEELHEHAFLHHSHIFAAEHIST